MTSETSMSSKPGVDEINTAIRRSTSGGLRGGAGAPSNELTNPAFTDKETSATIDATEADGHSAAEELGRTTDNDGRHVSRHTRETDEGVRGDDLATALTNDDGVESASNHEERASIESVEARSSAVSDEETAQCARVLKEGQVAEDFFRETASQLTYFGLSRLHQEVRGSPSSARNVVSLMSFPLLAQGSTLRFLVFCRSASASCASSSATITFQRFSSSRPSFTCS